VLAVKTTWAFAGDHLPGEDPEVEETLPRVRRTCERLLARAQQAGDLAADADISWTRRVCYALIHEAVRSDRGALPGLLRVGFPGPPAAPGVRLSPHRALHVPAGWFSRWQRLPVRGPMGWVSCCRGSGSGSP